MIYRVLVDDNYHYMDEAERYTLGEFPALAQAIEAAKRIVDEYLHSAHQPGMTAAALYASYTAFGEDPFIVAIPATDNQVLFSAWDYARDRCDELCASAQLPTEGLR
jgi:hypothetical protein